MSIKDGLPHSPQPTRISTLTWGGARIRCFGKQEEKDKAFREAYPDQFDTWFPNGSVPAGLSVSSKVPEIWCDLRQDGEGNIIMPMHVLGHEMKHILKLKDNRIVNPDTLVDNKTYKSK